MIRQDRLRFLPADFAARLARAWAATVWPHLVSGSTIRQASSGRSSEPSAAWVTHLVGRNLGDSHSPQYSSELDRRPRSDPGAASTGLDMTSCPDLRTLPREW